MSSVEGDLEARLSDLWQAGQAAWPELVVPSERFAAFVRARLTGDGADDVAAALSALSVPDLFLACACVEGVPGAIATFDRVLMTRVPAWVKRLEPSPAFADEVCQRLREKLFVPAEGPPKIVLYSGRASLLSWLRVVALRTALNLLDMHNPDRNRALDEEALATPTGDDPELDLLKRQYRDQFEAAVQAALAGLPQEQRRALRFHLLGGLSTTQIGVLLKVHQTTVARWLAAARRQVRAETQRQLRAQLGLHSGEFESIAGLLLSRLDVSIETVLRDSGSG
jgi:RNA polymerase sigma-70 factor